MTRAPSECMDEKGSREDPKCKSFIFVKSFFLFLFQVHLFIHNFGPAARPSHASFSDRLPRLVGQCNVWAFVGRFTLACKKVADR